MSYTQLTEKILESQYQSIIRRVIFNNATIDEDWTGFNGKKNFKDYFRPDLLRALKKNKEIDLSDVRNARMTQFFRLNTKNGGYTRSNLTVVVSNPTLVNTRSQDKSKYGISKDKYPVRRKMKKGVGTISETKLTTGDDPKVHPLYRVYQIEDLTLSIGSAIKWWGFPKTDTLELMVNDFELTLKEAGRKAFKSYYDKIVEINGEEMSAIEAAATLAGKWDKYTPSQILSLVEDDGVDWSEIEDYVAHGNRSRMATFFWQVDPETGEVGSTPFGSRQIAADVLGISKHTIADKVKTGESTKQGWYFTNDENPPEALKSRVETANRRQRLFNKMMKSHLENTNSKLEIEIMEMIMVEGKSDEQIAEELELTTSQVQRFVPRAMNNMEQGGNIVRRSNPKDVEGEVPATGNGTPAHERTTTKADVYKTEFEKQNAFTDYNTEGQNIGSQDETNIFKGQNEQ